MRCPTCRRVLAEESVCPRCGTDCSLVCSLDLRRRSLLARGARSLQDGRAPEARDAFLEAYQIRRDAEGARGLALTALVAGRYREALAWYFRSAGHREKG